MNIDLLLEKYAGDMYDDMDMNIRIVSKKMGRDIKDLQNAGFEVTSSNFPDYDVDGSINLSDGSSVTVTLDGTYYTAVSKGHQIVFSKEYNNLKDVIKSLKKGK